MSNRWSASSRVGPLVLLLAACEPSPSADAPPAPSPTTPTSVRAASSSAAIQVHEGAWKETETAGLHYPTDGVLTLVDQEVSVFADGAPPPVQTAFCAELTASDAHLRCAAKALERGPVIALTPSGTSLAIRGRLLVRTGVGHDVAHQLEAAYDAEGDPVALAREGARRWVKRYQEGLARHTHAPPKAVVALSRGEPRSGKDRADVIAGDDVFEIVTADEPIPTGGTFSVVAVATLTPGRPVERTQVIDETVNMPNARFELRGAIAWDADHRRLVVARGKAALVEDKAVPGGPCKSEDDCPGLTLVAYDVDARPTILTRLTDLVLQSGPVVVGGDVYVLGAAGSDMFVVRFHDGAAPERTKIDLPVDRRTAMRLVPLGADAIGALHVGTQYTKQSLHRFSVAKGKVGAVKKIPLPTPAVEPDGHGGLIVVSGSETKCKLIALDDEGAERWRIEAPQVGGRCPTPDVAGDVVSLPKVGWFAWKDGKAVGPKSFEGTSLARVGELFVACTEKGIGAWTADGTPRATVELPGGCERVGADTRGGVLVVAESAGAYQLSPPDKW